MSDPRPFTHTLSSILNRRPPDTIDDLLDPAKSTTLVELIVKRLIYSAVQGDSRAISTILERVEGPPPDSTPEVGRIKIEWVLPGGTALNPDLSRQDVRSLLPGMTSNSDLSSFLAIKTERDENPDGGIPKDELWGAYKEYCREHKIAYLPKATFLTRLRRMGYSTAQREACSGRPVIVVLGLRWRTSD